MGFTSRGVSEIKIRKKLVYGMLLLLLRLCIKEGAIKFEIAPFLNFISLSHSSSRYVPTPKLEESLVIATETNIPHTSTELFPAPELFVQNKNKAKQVIRRSDNRAPNKLMETSGSSNTSL